MTDELKPELHPDLTDDEVRERLLTGIRLFNASEHFESHEYFEEVWRSSNPEPRDLFQGLVQVAAAFHVWTDRGTSAPAARLMERGIGRLEGLEPTPMGVDLESLLDDLDPWLAWLQCPTNQEPGAPRIRLVSASENDEDDAIIERTAACPWCGEPLSWSVDPSGGQDQEYVEDCAVCCRPCCVRISLRDGVDIEISTE